MMNILQEKPVRMVSSQAIREGWMVLLGKNNFPLWEGPRGAMPPASLSKKVTCVLISPKDYEEMLEWRKRKYPLM